jgi:hypothetical protein
MYETMQNIALAATALAGAIGLAAVPVILEAIKAYADRFFENRRLIREYNEQYLELILAGRNNEAARDYHRKLAEAAGDASDELQTIMDNWSRVLSLKYLVGRIPGMYLLSACLFAGTAALLVTKLRMPYAIVLAATGCLSAVLATYSFWRVIQALHELRFLSAARSLIPTPKD